MLCEICVTNEACIQASLRENVTRNYCKDCYWNHLRYCLEKSHGKADTTFCNKCERPGNFVAPLKVGFDSNNRFGLYCPDCLSIAGLFVNYEIQIPGYTVYIEEDDEFPEDDDDDEYF